MPSCGFGIAELPLTLIVVVSTLASFAIELGTSTESFDEDTGLSPLPTKIKTGTVLIESSL